MNQRISISGILAVALVGCQNPEYTKPEESNTGTPPRAPNTIYEFHSESSATYLGPDLEQSNAVTAAFVNTEAGLTTMPINGLQPDFAGAEANLLAGVGFGTYANPDYRQPVTWATAGDFKSVVTAEITFTSPGDSVLICRSFATTCVELIHNYLPGINIAIVRLAANIPDTDIGEIAPGISAAVRGTGPNGLTIALTNEDIVAMPFGAAAGTPFTLDWSIARGDTEGSLDWSVSITTSAGTATSDGNTAADMAASIVQTGGVGLIFDTPLNNGGVPFAVDYTYSYDGGEADDFYDPYGVRFIPPPLDEDPYEPVDLTPQYGLGYAPLYVYPTYDGPHQLGTQSGVEGTLHAVQWNDGVIGAVTQLEGSSSQQFVYSVEFNGDDFPDIAALEGLDQGGVGGGFYPSPSFCYSQILPQVQTAVEGGVRAESHRMMYARMGTGVASADASLPTLVAGINANFSAAVGSTLVYTDLVLADAIAIGTDYADNNVDAAISTSAAATYNATLTQTVSTTFRTQLGAVFTALSIDLDATAGTNFIWQALGMSEQQYRDLGALLIGLTTPPGIMDGYFDGTEAVFDEYPGYDTDTCFGFACNVDWILQDIVRGDDTHPAVVNGSDDIPVLATACLWGSPATDIPARPASPAVLNPDGNFFNDAPAYAAVAAFTSPAVAPVRETAAASMNGLVMGMYGNFQSAVFGPGVPASNFSLAMGAGDPTAATGPLLTSLVITNGMAATAE